MATPPIDLLKVARKLDPRFTENMPEEVAKAFSEGRVKRLFRTSDKLPDEGEMSAHRVSSRGTYGGSIYVELENGQTARWKSPELSASSDAFSGSGSDAGWNANKGQNIFSDKSYILGKNYEDEARPLAKELIDKGIIDTSNPMANNSATLFNTMADRNSPHLTQLNDLTSEQLAGGQVYERISGSGGHRGHRVSEVFDSSGRRHYFAGEEGRLRRGPLSSESIEDFFGGPLERKMGIGPKELFSNEKIKHIGEFLENSGFAQKEFRFPGSDKIVTGQNILDHIQEVEPRNLGGAVGAAFDIESKTLVFDPENIIFNGSNSQLAIDQVVHEIGHAGSSLTGANKDLVSAAARAKASGVEDLEGLIALGREEGRADSFARQVVESTGNQYTPGYGKGTGLIETMAKQQGYASSSSEASDIARQVRENFGFSEDFRPGFIAYAGSENAHLVGKALSVGQTGDFSSWKTLSEDPRILSLQKGYTETESSDILLRQKSTPAKVSASATSTVDSIPQGSKIVGAKIVDGKLDTSSAAVVIPQDKPVVSSKVDAKPLNLGTSRADTVRTGPRFNTPAAKIEPIIPVGSEVVNSTATATSSGATAAANTGVKQADNAVARSVAKSEAIATRSAVNSTSKSLSKAVAQNSKNLTAIGLGAVLTLGTFGIVKRTRESKNRALAQNQQPYYHDSAAKIKSIGY